MRMLLWPAGQHYFDEQPDAITLIDVTCRRGAWLAIPDTGAVRLDPFAGSSSPSTLPVIFTFLPTWFFSSPSRPTSM